MKNSLVAHPVVVGHGRVEHVAPVILVALAWNGLRAVVGEAPCKEGPQRAVVHLVHGALARPRLVIGADLCRQELLLPTIQTDIKPFWRHEVWRRAPVVYITIRAFDYKKNSHKQIC